MDKHFGDKRLSDRIPVPFARALAMISAQPNVVSVNIVRNTAVVDMLLDQGVNPSNLVPVSTPEQALKMLYAGRVQLIAHIPDVLNYFVRQTGGVALDLKLPLHSGDFYFAFSRDIDDTDISSLQFILNDALSTQQLNALRNTYQLRSD